MACERDSSRREHLVTRLKGAGFVVDEESKQEGDRERDPYCAIVLGGRAELDDIDWFKTALEAAGGKPVNYAISSLSTNLKTGEADQKKSKTPLAASGVRRS